MRQVFVPGEVYRIAAMAPAMNQTLRHKLLAMGLLPGANIKIHHIAPLGDPIELLVDSFSICVRRQDLHQLTLEPVMP